MKSNKEKILTSDALSLDGRMMAMRLMKEDGLSIEKLFNILGQLQSDVIELRRELREVDRATDIVQSEFNDHISNHD